ncbi:MAG: Trp family transcriptional regulator [Candidatus Paceibacterota bacterium]
MKELSKFKSRKEWEDFVWSKIIEDLKKLKSEKEIDGFLRNLLGSGERKMIIKRAVAISLIKQGKKYRDIGEILWISPSTISSIKKNIKNRTGYQGRQNLGKKMPKPREKYLFEDWFNFLPPPPRMVGKGRWRSVNI